MPQPYDIHGRRSQRHPKATSGMTSPNISPGVVARPDTQAAAAVVIKLPRRLSDLDESVDMDHSATLPRKRTSTACDHCRRRKTKCDGAIMGCQACTSIGLVCAYGKATRRLSGQAYVAYLEDKVQRLEHELKTRPLNFSSVDWSGVSSQTTGSSNGGGDTPPGSGDDHDDVHTSRQEHLNQDYQHDYHQRLNGSEIIDSLPSSSLARHSSGAIDQRFSQLHQHQDSPASVGEVAGLCPATSSTIGMSVSQTLTGVGTTQFLDMNQTGGFPDSLSLPPLTHQFSTSSNLNHQPTSNEIASQNHVSANAFDRLYPAASALFQRRSSRSGTLPFAVDEKWLLQQRWDNTADYPMQ